MSMFPPGQAWCRESPIRGVLISHVRFFLNIKMQYLVADVILMQVDSQSWFRESNIIKFVSKPFSEEKAT